MNIAHIPNECFFKKIAYSNTNANTCILSKKKNWDTKNRRISFQIICFIFILLFAFVCNFLMYFVCVDMFGRKISRDI